ncbi:site-specific integrase, partial [Singulisphaera rosea]
MPKAPRNVPDHVGPFLHYLMAECGVSPHTQTAYRTDLAKFVQWRKEHAPGPLEKIGITVLTGYVAYLGGCGLAPTSIARHLASLSTYFRFLILDGHVTENVAKLLVAPAIWDSLPTVLGPTAVAKLLTTPSENTRL